jgi:hypothetical protein
MTTAKKEKEPGADRRPYAKPKLEEVKLVAEEAVLKGCKSQVISGPGKPSCGAPFAQCKGAGS